MLCAFVTYFSIKVRSVVYFLYELHSDVGSTSYTSVKHRHPVNSLEQFETRLDKFWGNQDVMFDWTPLK